METPHQSKQIKIEAFRTKVAQTSKLLDEPLLILNLSERNPNYVMYTLGEEHASPTAIIIDPDGSTSLVVSNIELDLVAHLEEHCVVRLYAGMTEFYKCLYESLPQAGRIYVETADQIPDLDLVPRRTHARLSGKFTLLSAQDILIYLRSHKTKSEISFINAAVKLTNDIFEKLAPLIKAGTTEEAIAQAIMIAIIQENAGISFKPIVASGPRIINPHPVRFTARKLQQGDWLIIDFGLSINGYTSDLTRTYLVGGDYTEHLFYRTYKEMLDLLYETDLSKTTPQRLAGELRNLACKNEVDVFEKHGYGHGLGVAIHDIFPTISTYSGHLSDKFFTENVVFTFEPGFYQAEGKNIGFRLENDFLVKNGKAFMLG